VATVCGIHSDEVKTPRIDDPVFSQSRISKMTNLPTTTPVKRSKNRKSTYQASPVTPFPHLMYEIFNQLTVMNLCCFKFRAAVTPLNDVRLQSEFDRLNKTTTDLTELLENLFDAQAQSGSRMVTRRDKAELDASPANVYPLFRPIRGSR
jgi:hypothetical protein